MRALLCLALCMSQGMVTIKEFGHGFRSRLPEEHEKGKDAFAWLSRHGWQVVGNGDGFLKIASNKAFGWNVHQQPVQHAQVRVKKKKGETLVPVNLKLLLLKQFMCYSPM